MDKEVVVHIFNEYYSVIKGNKIKSVVVMWMNLELSYRVKLLSGKQILNIEPYMWNLEKLDDLIKADIERDMYEDNKCVDTKGKEWVGD